jgi:predicted HTH domain antitoxin
MSIIISDEFLQTAKITSQEIKQEIAIFLFQKTKLTLAQAASFAETNRINFQHLLASRNIPIHYDNSDFDQDLKTVMDILHENCQ